MADETPPPPVRTNPELIWEGYRPAATARSMHHQATARKAWKSGGPHRPDMPAGRARTLPQTELPQGQGDRRRPAPVAGNGGEPGFFLGQGQANHVTR